MPCSRCEELSSRQGSADHERPLLGQLLAEASAVKTFTALHFFLLISSHFNIF